MKLRQAAEKAWGDDTRHAAYKGHPQPSAGQCYVTSRWLTHHLGGHVGRKHGHYFWVSPDETHGLDLTGDLHAFRPEDPSLEGMKFDEEDSGLVYEDHHKKYRPGPAIHKTLDHPHFKGHEIVPANESDGAFNRSTIFMQRANRALLNPHEKIAVDWMGDGLPAEEPQKSEDIQQRFLDTENRYWHDEPNYTPGSGNYQFVYANGQLHVDPKFDHDTLSQQIGVSPGHSGPFAAGHVYVNAGTATWEIDGNVSPNAFVRVLKDYTKHLGWQWGGMMDSNGFPVGEAEQFAPKKSTEIWWTYNYPEEQLYLSSKLSHIYMDGQAVGVAHKQGTNFRISHIGSPEVFDALQEYAEDHGLTLVGANDNVIKRIEDIQQQNLYSPQGDGDFSAHPHEIDDRQPGGVFKCPECLNIYPSWSLYLLHKQDHAKEEPEQHSAMPQLPDMHSPGPSNRFMEQDMPKINTGSLQEAERVDSYWCDGLDDEFHVAYLHGCPIGVLTMYDDNINQIVNPTKSEVVREALIRHAMLTHDEVCVSDHLPGFTYIRPNLFKWAKDTKPSDLVENPIPFIYDIKDDKIFVGHPGARHSDIIGKFTPGGIVEGTYEPGGKVIMNSLSNMPYTVRHMLELWYHTHPHLEIKSVHLMDEQGKNIKLAGPPEGRVSADIGGYVSSMVAADPVAYKASQALRKAGGKVYAVGGAVRDAVAGYPHKDVDLMVTGLPREKIMETLELDLPGQMDITGKDFGVFRYKERGHDVEIAMPRRDRSTGSGHKNFDVQADPTMKIEEDLLRRDYTPNAMAVDLDSGRLVDPFGGVNDIKNGTFRTLNKDSLKDDPLRTMRGLVLNGRYGWQPTDETREQMREHAPRLSELPGERVQGELDKLLESNDPASAIKLAQDTGVLQHFLPEVASTFGYDQKNPHHAYDLGTHILNVLGNISTLTDDKDLRLAALMHDVGKPASAWWHPEQGRQKFYRWQADRDYTDPQGNVTIPKGTFMGQDHHTVGADMTRARMEALRYSKDRTDRVSTLIQHHMYPSFNGVRGARKFMQKVGPHADDLMTLRDADMGGKGTDQSDKTPAEIQRNLVEQVRNMGEPTQLSQLAITGNDLIQLGIPQGPLIGQVLQQLMSAVVENPEINDRNQLLELARSYAGV